MVAGPQEDRGNITLDRPPPLPPRTATRDRTMMNAGQSQSLGAEGGTPQVQALMAAQQIEQGFRQLVELLPETAQIAAAAITAMRQTVAESLAGTGAQPGAGAGMSMPPPPPPAGMSMPPTPSPGGMAA